MLEMRWVEDVYSHGGWRLEYRQWDYPPPSGQWVVVPHETPPPKHADDEVLTLRAENAALRRALGQQSEQVWKLHTELWELRYDAKHKRRWWQA